MFTAKKNTIFLNIKIMRRPVNHPTVHRLEATLFDVLKLEDFTANYIINSAEYWLDSLICALHT